ncbi:MAG TPA: NDP-sugar synthase [Candidatus Binataceae bacterium]|nr:NDP-sugar synthase [Candidatus Binataceae bacterium]
MRALVLAAGLGERLRPLTDQIPKPLLELGGRPLIHYPLMMLRRAGITEIAVNVHHLAQQIQLALGDGAALGLKLFYAPETTLLGTGGPLLGLRSFFGEDSFVVANADTLLDLDLAAMIAAHRERRALVTFAVRASDKLGAYSRLELDATARLRRIRFLRRGGFLEDVPAKIDPKLEPALRAYMYCGVYVCAPQALAGPMPAAPFSSIEHLFAPMLARDLPLYGYLHRGFFVTVDDLAGYEALRRQFAERPPPL